MTNATRLAQLRLFYTAQLNSLVNPKEKMLKSTTSLMLYESTTIPPMLFPMLFLKRKFSKPTTNANPTPEELVCTFFKWAAPHENPNSFALLPFINGVTQPLTQILRRYDIQVVNNPLKTYKNFLLPNSDHQLNNVVYKIPCADCEWCYIGETGRCFETRKKEHVKNNVKTLANGSSVVI